MSYNLSLINGSGLVPLVQTVNERLMFGWYGSLILLALFVILFFAFVRNTGDAKRSFSWSATVVALLSLPLRALGLVNDYTVFITWIIVAVSVFFLFLKD